MDRYLADTSDRRPAAWQNLTTTVDIRPVGPYACPETGHTIVTCGGQHGCRVKYYYQNGHMCGYS